MVANKMLGLDVDRSCLTLMNFSKKLILKKITWQQKRMQNYSVGKELNPIVIFLGLIKIQK